jgi:hypothetical protein
MGEPHRNACLASTTKLVFPVDSRPVADCGRCGLELPLVHGIQCPKCGAAISNGGVAESDHKIPPVGVGSGASEAAPIGGAKRRSRPRLTSAAGPSMPLPRDDNDSAPVGWMAGFIAEKTAGAPPPLPKRNAPPPVLKSKSTLESATPAAAFMVAKLREDSKSEANPFHPDDEPSEVSSVKIQLDTPKPNVRRLPPIVTYLLYSLVVSAAVWVGVSMYFDALEEPPPEVKVNPALAQAAKIHKEALEALQKGHESVLEGRTGASAAIGFYEKALALEPSLAPAVRGMAIAYGHKGDEAVAVEHYRNYLRLDPDSKDADSVREIISKYEASLAASTAKAPPKSSKKARKSKRRRSIQKH